MEKIKYRCVYWNEKDKRFRTSISLDGKKVSVGSFKDAKEASDAVEAYLRKHHGERLEKILKDCEPGEIFKDIPGYENKYQISNFGRVKSLSSKSSQTFLKPVLDNKGYYKIALVSNGKLRAGFIHILVAEAFLGHKSDGTHKITVDHIDSDKANNRSDNLRLVSNRFNSTKDVMGDSIYPGVRKENNRWSSGITIQNKFIRLGLFDIELDAAKAYFNKVKELGHNVPEEFVNLRYHPY